VTVLPTLRNLDVVEGMLARFEADYPTTTEIGTRTFWLRGELRALIAELRKARTADRALLAQMASTIVILADGDFDPKVMATDSLVAAREILRQIDNPEPETTP
jgi:hypothetical protein